jgi:hypothetical protein
MGDSDKLPNSGPGRYSFRDHQHYLYTLLDVLHGCARGILFAKLRSPEGERVRSYSDWLVSESDQPKLFVRADPNAVGRALARWIAAL